MSTHEIEEEIRRTRARMTGTLNTIEARISPARIKSEIKESLHDTMDDVRERYHPQRVAKRAGDHMLDIVREHPVPALIAGLSIGYMFMKGRSEHGDERFDRYRTRGFGMTEPWDYRFEADWYRDQVYPSRHTEYPAQYESEEDESGIGEQVENLKHRAADTTRKVREEADEALHTVRRRADEAMHGARDQARRAGRNIRRGAYRAEHTVEDFVHENPMMAGLLAAGAGALLGSILPPTDFEDRRMGGMRDELIDEGKETVREVKERAKHVADDAKDELQESGKRVMETAKSEAREMGGSREGTSSTQGQTGGSTETTGRGQTGGSSETTGRGQTGGSSETTGRGQTGGSSEMTGRGQKGGSSGTMGRGQKGGSSASPGTARDQNRGTVQNTSRKGGASAPDETTSH